MAITAALVKELRERTGAGMMECKKALELVNGDIEKAIENMRKAGQAAAAKKAGRIAADGVIAAKISPDGKKGVMIEVNCETDFVARDHNFLKFVENVANQALSTNSKDLDSLLAAFYEDGKTVAQAREDIVAKIGENITIRRSVMEIADGVIGSYVHSNNRIGVLVSLSVDNKELAKDIAMHIAASKPIAIKPEDLPKDLLAKEKEIYLAQAKESGKPEAILEKMVEGKLQKFINESTLIKQAFVKDQDVLVGDLLKKAGAIVTSFTRYEVGEGIEKKGVDFAEEVRAQLETRN